VPSSRRRRLVLPGIGVVCPPPKRRAAPTRSSWSTITRVGGPEVAVGAEPSSASRRFHRGPNQSAGGDGSSGFVGNQRMGSRSFDGGDADAAGPGAISAAGEGRPRRRVLAATRSAPRAINATAPKTRDFVSVPVNAIVLAVPAPLAVPADGGAGEGGAARRWGRSRWSPNRVREPNVLVLAVPQLILFGGMLVMLVVHPNAVRSVLMSTHAILINAGLLAVWLMLSFLVLSRVLTNSYLRAAALRVVAVAGVRARRADPPRQEGGGGVPDAGIGAAAELPTRSRPSRVLEARRRTLRHSRCASRPGSSAGSITRSVPSVRR
jgi:hypothetical protein